MKRLFVFLLILGIYLNRSYAYFYNFLSQHSLVAPTHEETMIVGSSPRLQTIKYIALGDSLTAGVGVSDYKNSLAFTVAENLSLKNNVELINFARSGYTTKDVLENQLTEVISENPNVITLLIGVNDLHNLKSLQEFENNYVQIVSTLKKTNAKIYLLSIPYLGSKKIVYFPYNLILDFRTKQFNNVIKKISFDYKIEFIDLYSLKKSSDFYSEDQFHPGENGYKEWVRMINVN